MSRRVIRVNETQAREHIAQLRSEMDAIEQDPPEEQTDEEGKSLETLVEDKLKYQLTHFTDKELGYALVNAIKFLAVKAKLPMVYGSELEP